MNFYSNRIHRPFNLVLCCVCQHTKPGEPLYAQVNREKKKNRQYEGGGVEGVTAGTPQYEGEHWQYDERRPAADSRPPAGGDSWV